MEQLIDLNFARSILFAMFFSMLLYMIIAYIKWFIKNSKPKRKRLTGRFNDDIL